MTGTSPPGPLRCGSTTCSVKAVATAASKALPPFSSVAMPTAVAIQCVEATTPNVPSISGRVVKGLGLMFFMNCLRDGSAQLITSFRCNQPDGTIFRSCPGGSRQLSYESHPLPTKVTFPLASVAVEIGGHPMRKIALALAVCLISSAPAFADLQVGCGRQEARGRGAQELPDEVREGCEGRPARRIPRTRSSRARQRTAT